MTRPQNGRGIRISMQALGYTIKGHAKCKGRTGAASKAIVWLMGSQNILQNEKSNGLSDLDVCLTRTTDPEQTQHPNSKKRPLIRLVISGALETRNPLDTDWGQVKKRRESQGDTYSANAAAEAGPLAGGGGWWWRHEAAASATVEYPWRCLCLALALQWMKTIPRRLTTLQKEHSRFTDARTFIFLPRALDRLFFLGDLPSATASRVPSLVRVWRWVSLDESVCSASRGPWAFFEIKSRT
jgi:hypothetical protein